VDTIKKPVPVGGKAPAPVVGTLPTALSTTQTILSGSVKLVYEKPVVVAKQVAGKPKLPKKKKGGRPKLIPEHRVTGLGKHLGTWISLNAFLTDCGEVKAAELLDLEVNGKARKMFILRIHSRYNRIRAARERLALIKVARDFERYGLEEIDEILGGLSATGGVNNA
jgi:hypothetical protein